MQCATQHTTSYPSPTTGGMPYVNFKRLFY